MSIMVEIAAWLIILNFVIKFCEAFKIECRKNKIKAAAKAK